MSTNTFLTSSKPKEVNSGLNNSKNLFAQRAQKQVTLLREYPMKVEAVDNKKNLFLLANIPEKICYQEQNKCKVEYDKSFQIYAEDQEFYRAKKVYQKENGENANLQQFEDNFKAKLEENFKNKIEEKYGTGLDISEKVKQRESYINNRSVALILNSKEQKQRYQAQTFMKELDTDRKNCYGFLIIKKKAASRGVDAQFSLKFLDGGFKFEDDHFKDLYEGSKFFGEESQDTKKFKEELKKITQKFNKNKQEEDLSGKKRKNDVGFSKNDYEEMDDFALGKKKAKKNNDDDEDEDEQFF